MNKRYALNFRYIAILVVVIFFIIYQGSKKISIPAESHYRRIDPISIEYPNKSKGVHVFGSPVSVEDVLIDGSKHTYISIPSKQGSYEEIKYYFKNEKIISKINIDFPDNNPKNIIIKIKNNDDWKIVSSKDNFTESTFFSTLNKENISPTTLVIILLSSIDNKSNITVSNLYIEEKLPQNLIERLPSNLSLSRGGSGYVIYSFVIFILIFIIGTAFSNRYVIKNKDIRINEIPKIITYGIFSFAIIGIIDCLLPFSFRGIFPILSVLFSIFYLFFIKRVSFDTETLTVLFLSLVFMLQTGIFSFNKDQSYKDLMIEYDNQYDNTDSVHYPYGPFEMDYTLPFSVSKMLYYEIPSDSILKPSLLSVYKLFDRTPLFSLFSIPFLELFGDRFFVFQNISIALSGIFLTSSYLLLKIIFNKKIAVISSLVLILNPYLLFASHFFQTKLILVFMTSYLLYSVITEIKTKEKVNLRISSLGAFLIHPFAITFIMTSALVQLFSYKDKFRVKVMRLIKCYLPVLIAIIVWITVGLLTPGKSLFSALSVSTNWRTSISNGKETIKQPEIINTINESLTIRFNNLKGLFVKDPFVNKIRPFGPLRTTIPGLLTYSVFLLAIVGTFYIKRKQLLFTIIFSLIIIIITDLYIGSYANWSLNEWLMGTIPLFISIAVYFVCHLRKFIYQVLFIISLCAEHFYISWIKFGYEANIKSTIMIFDGRYPLSIFIPYVLVLFSLITIHFIHSKKNNTFR